jgi:hypothetical protein
MAADAAELLERRQALSFYRREAARQLLRLVGDAVATDTYGAERRSMIIELLDGLSDAIGELRVVVPQLAEAEKAKQVGRAIPVTPQPRCASVPKRPEAVV